MNVRTHTSTKLGTAVSMSVRVATAELIIASSVSVRAGLWGLNAVNVTPVLACAN